jgi:unsaturated rhamnogalacturonyl hydrolase
MKTSRRETGFGLLAIALPLALTAAAVAPGEASAATTTRFLQAETAVIAAGCDFDLPTPHLNFTGTGYVDCPADMTSTIQWNGVKVQSTGTKRLKFRFANAGAANRPAEVMVNGVAVTTTLAFNPTGSWDTWAFTATVDVTLNAGSDNTIRLRATNASGMANIDRVDVSEISEVTPDWSIAMAESTMLRSPLPQNLGDWEYSRALVLHGMYLLFKRTGDVRYLNYLKAWVDKHTNTNGDIINDDGSVRSLNALDYMLPGNAVLDWWLEDSDPNKGLSTNKYRRMMQTIRNRLTNANNTSGGLPNWSTAYPRNSDSGFWHSTGATDQMWLDGVFMAQKFNVRYGNQFGDSTYAFNEATTQLLDMDSHLKDTTTGLYWHAYDQPGGTTQPWVVAGTSHSPEFWCRAMGWYGMTLVETLETLPTGHANYAATLAALQGLIPAWANFQDPATGRWFQVVNKATNPSNWTETSCSSMYGYVISRSIQLGYVSASFRGVANAAYDGVLQKITFNPENATLFADLTDITDISEGTNVGANDTYYFTRMRPVNDRHGLGAFLIMYDHFATNVPPVPTAPSALAASDGMGQSALTWTDSSSDEGAFRIERKPLGAPDTSFVQVGWVSQNITTFTDIVAAGSYTYRVRASAGPTFSDYSSSDDATVTAPPGPAAPSNLTATISGGNTGDLSWTDNSNNETGFRVERKVGAGSYSTLATKGVNVTSHSDPSLTANTYTYRVIATGSPDSAPSNEVVVVIRNSEADAHVRDGASADNNYGANTTMEVKNNATAGNNRQAFVRFTLADLTPTVTMAKLRVFGSSVTSTKIIAISAVSDVTWVEGTGTIAAPVTATGIDWNGKPAIGSQLASQSVTTTAGWWEFDVTSYVAAQKTAGATKVTFAITMVTSSSETPTSFNAKENASSKPLLVISSGP